MGWPVIWELQDEHTRVVAEMEALAAVFDEVADNEHALEVSDVARLREQAEEFRHSFLIHRLKEEDVLFPEFQKLMSDEAPEADILSPFFAGEARDDMQVHLEIHGHMRELMSLLEALENATISDPQVLTQARARVTVALDLLREHAKKEDEVVFPLMERLLTADQRSAVERRLEAFRAGAGRRSVEGDSLRVLIADDDEGARDLLADLLTQAGYRVVRAENGRQAWEILVEGAHDIAVLDWMMPGMDGAALCRALRQQQTESYIYIILVTGKSDTSDLVLGLEAGADDYLRKPLSVEELRARVRVGERIVRMQQEAKRTSQKLIAAALTDEVTGLPNRRAILKRLEEEHQRRDREGRPLSILLADLDDFKQVNDTCGHGAGDSALQEFARRASSAVRPYDVTGRFGGDEFLIILPGAAESQAAAVGERVRSAVSGKVFDLDAAGTRRVTASYGVAEVDAKLTLKEALARADQALYAAKTKGGNRVCTPSTS